MKRQRFWCVLSNDDSDPPGVYRFAPWGNGTEWQYPIFPSRAEARSFKRIHELEGRLKIVPCRIQLGAR